MINANQSGLSIPKPLELSCLASAVLENVYWLKGGNVFSHYWETFTVNCDVPNYRGLNSGQFVERHCDRKTVGSFHTCKVTRRLSSLANKRWYKAAYINTSLGAVTNGHVFSGLEDSLVCTWLLFLQISG